MTVLRINPKVGLAENLRLNGIDPVNYVRDYTRAIIPLYLNVTEGSGDISALTAAPATRGGSRYRKLRTTRRLKGGDQENSRPTLKTVCTIAIVVGILTLGYAASEYSGFAIADADATSALADASFTCSKQGIDKAAAAAAVAAAVPASFIRMLFTSPLEMVAAGDQTYWQETRAITAKCKLIELAAKDAATNLLLAQARDQVIGAAGACVAGAALFLKTYIEVEEKNRRERVITKGKQIEETHFGKPASASASASASAPKVSHLNFNDLGAQNGGDPNNNDIILIDTTDPENIITLMKAQAVFLAGEKMKATTARSVLSLVGAAKPVTSIAGQKLPSEDSPTSSTPKQGGGVPKVSYIEMKKTLIMLGVLPQVVDEILANSSNPSLTEEANTNK
jgi:hypothetical protein